MKTEITTADYSLFIVTGKDRSGKRFRLCYSNGFAAFSINLWCGTVWGVRKIDGKREKLKTVFN